MRASDLCGAACPPPCEFGDSGCSHLPRHTDIGPKPPGSPQGGRTCAPDSSSPPRRVMAVPATVIYFTAYDQLRDYLHARMGSWSHCIPLLAGALARRECPSSVGSPHAHPVSWQQRVARLSAHIQCLALLVRCWWLRDSQSKQSSFPVSLCCSGCCDSHQPPGADPHQDAVPAAELP